MVRSASGGPDGAQPSSAERPPGGNIDWVAAEESPEFRELIAKRRAFVLPATIFFLAFFLGFILLSSYAKEFMGSQIVAGFTWGYLYALLNFLMVIVIGLAYNRRSERVFAPLSEKAAAKAVHSAGASTPGSRGAGQARPARPAEGDAR
jgi:uncharacterized membrane protein (DUF485 family)